MSESDGENSASTQKLAHNPTFAALQHKLGTSFTQPANLYTTQHSGECRGGPLSLDWMEQGAPSIYDTCDGLTPTIASVCGRRVIRGKGVV